MDNFIARAAQLQTDQAHRATDSLQKTARLAIRPPTSDAFTNGLDLATATWQRTLQMQGAWMKNWGEWALYAQSLQGVDTIPKLVARSGNIVLQAQAQMTNQVSEASELMDNVGVSYAFWLNQQFEDDETGSNRS